MENTIYLDTAATSKVDKQAFNRAIRYCDIYFENPSSLYRNSKNIRTVVDKATRDIAKKIGAKSNEIFFTSGGSESNCWAIQGFINYWSKYKYKPVIITSTIEHKSILDCADYFSDKAQVHYINVNRFGFVNLEELKTVLKKYSNKNKIKVLVSIQTANNEIGTIQHIRNIADMVHKYNGYFHTDAVQAVGKLPIDVNKLHVDMLSASAHKFHGFKGIGFLYIKDGVSISPLIFGTQNYNKRGGTENVQGIVSMATALNNCKQKLDEKTKIKNNIICALNKLPYRLRINAEILYNSLPDILSVTICEDVTAEAVLYMLDSAGIQISSGSACNSRTNKPSHVLRAIGLSDWDSVRTIRISFDENLTDEDIDRFVSELGKAIKILIS